MRAKGSLDVIRACSRSLRRGSSFPQTSLFTKPSSAAGSWSFPLSREGFCWATYQGWSSPPLPPALEKRIVYWSSNAFSFFRFSFSASAFFSRLTASFMSTGNRSMFPAWSCRGASMAVFRSFRTLASLSSPPEAVMDLARRMSMSVSSSPASFLLFL